MASRPIPSLKNKQIIKYETEQTINRKRIITTQKKKQKNTFFHIKSHLLVPAGLSSPSYRAIHNVIRHEEKSLNLHRTAATL